MMLLTEIGPTFVFVLLSSKRGQQTPDRESESEMRTYSTPQ